MAQTDPTDRDGVSKLSRRGMLALAGALAGTSSLGLFSDTASAHELTAFRDAFIGDDVDKQGLGSKGWLFFAKDTGTLYFHNGSSWVDMGIGGSSTLTDTDEDGLLEAPKHGGIDVGQVEADAVSADAISATNEISAGELYTDSVTVFVRPDGEDANDGLTESNAKATVQAAVDDAPVHGDHADLLEIDIGGGSYGSLSTADRSTPDIYLAGDGTAELQGDPALHVRDNRLLFDGVTMTGTGTSRAVLVDGTGAIQFRGETVQNANGGNGLELQHNAFGFVRNATIEGDNYPVMVYSGNLNINDSTVNNTGEAATQDPGLMAWDRAMVFSGNNTFTNDGGGWGMVVRKGSTVKSENDTFDGFGAAFSIREYSGVQTGEYSLTNTDDLARGFAGAVLRDEDTSPPRNLVWNETRAEDPDVSDIRNPTGVMYHNNGSGSVAAGLRVYNDGWNAV